MRAVKSWWWLAALALVGCDAVLGLDARSLNLADSGTTQAGMGTPDATTGQDSSKQSPDEDATGGDVTAEASAEASVGDATSDGSSSEAGDAISEAGAPPFCATNPNGTPCGSGSSKVCNGGVCVPCDAGGSCDDPNMPCIHKTYNCSSGTAQCEQVGTVADGNSCGGSNYCFGGVCSPCQLNVACAPAANPCHVGRVTSCAGGIPTCSDQASNAGAGTSCQTSSVTGVCDGAGSCVACTVNAQCSLDSGCQTGTTTCSTGPMCTSPSDVNEGQPCGAAGNICHAGACEACNATSCSNGCCASSGCVTARTTSMCGPNGGACAACSLPQATPACGASGCTVSSCTTGYADCDGAPGNGCETPITTSTDCGRCGHDCGGGSCTNGACQPQTLASGIDTPTGMDVDANGIYFIVDGVVQSCPLNGCASGTTQLGSFRFATELAAANGSIAFFEGIMTDNVVLCPTTGCPSSITTLSYGGAPGGLIAYGGNIDALIPYELMVTVFRCTGASGTTCTSTYQQPYGAPLVPRAPIAEDGTYLYFTIAAEAGFDVVKCPLGTSCNLSSPTVVTTGFQVNAMVVYSSELYLTGLQTSSGDLYSCPVTGCSSPASINTGVYASTQNLVADQDGVYFSTSTGGIYTCPLTGCGGTGARAMASKQASPSIIRSDSQFVYWVDRGAPGDGSPAFVPGTASIMRVAK